MRNTLKAKAEVARRRAEQILLGLSKAYPDADCELEHGNPLDLLVATILSAQCTDQRVNVVTRELFRKFRSPKDYADTPQEALEGQIRSTGFYRNKARSILGMCRMLLEEYGGEVPETMEDLTRLPGVARKTANVVLGVAFGKAEGVVVDTHVFRVARRLELSRADTPEKVEADLMRLVPADRWISFSHEMIHHGRKVCQARKPACSQCPIEALCRSRDKPPAPRESGTERGAKRGR